MTTRTRLDWQEVERTEWERPRPPAPNGSCPAGTDYYVTVREQVTWPQDGSQYAGRRYEQRWVWQGPSPEYREHVVVSHSQYPAPADVNENRAAWDNPFKDVTAGPGLTRRLAAQLLQLPLQTEVGEGRWSPALKVASHGWDREDGERADAAGEPGSTEWTAALGTPREVVLTEDGRGAVTRGTDPWCHQDGHGAWVFYERWTAEGRQAHGWVCSECRRLLQAG